MSLSCVGGLGSFKRAEKLLEAFQTCVCVGLLTAEFVVGLRAVTVSCDGREVKALDSKFNGVSPRRFEPCSQRGLLCWSELIQEMHLGGLSSGNEL